MRYMILDNQEYVMMVDTKEKISSEFVSASIKEAIELFEEGVARIDINLLLKNTVDSDIKYRFNCIEEFKTSNPEEFI